MVLAHDEKFGLSAGADVERHIASRCEPAARLTLRQVRRGSGDPVDEATLVLDVGIRAQESLRVRVLSTKSERGRPKDIGGRTRLNHLARVHNRYTVTRLCQH